jgi:hypothetical protein
MSGDDEVKGRTSIIAVYILVPYCDLKVSAACASPTMDVMIQVEKMRMRRMRSVLSLRIMRRRVGT